MTEPLRLHAAGSLARAFARLDRAAGRRIEAAFGASGLLRTAIERGRAWDLFASADTGHPARLHRAGLGRLPRVLCHNEMCLILRSGLSGDDAAALLQRPDLRLGISTPGNDPSGDYALRVLERLDDIAPGAGAAARARALCLTGAPGLPGPPAGRSTYAWLMTSGAADLFLTYRTNAVVAQGDSPSLRVLELPEALSVRATYALTVCKDAAAAGLLADHLLSPEIQARLSEHGFQPAAAPQAQGSPA